MSDATAPSASPDENRIWMRGRKLLELIALADPAARRAFALAIALSTAAACVEIVSLLLVQKAASTFLAGSADNGQSHTIVALLCSMVASSALRLVSQRSLVKAQFAISTSLGVLAFSRLQKQDYATYLDSGASRAFSAFEDLQVVCFNALIPFTGGLVSLMTTMLFAAVLTYLYPVAGLVLLSTAAMVGMALRLRQKPPSDDAVPELSRRRARLIYEARTAFRDLCLTNGQDRIIADFEEIERAFRGRLATTVIAGQTARSEIELIGLTLGLLAVMTFPLLGVQPQAMVPALGVLGLAGLRLLPHLAAIRSATAQVALHGELTSGVQRLLVTKEPAALAAPSLPVQFRHSVNMSAIRMARPGRADTLKGVDLAIPVGARIGIVGPSGSGKSTLLDIVCGLIQPTEGVVKVDGVPVTPDNAPAWRERIGVVSQNALLVGNTLREAICYPARPSDADVTHLTEIVVQSDLDRFVRSLPQGLDTALGEAMSRISGGQRQRLALAHALLRARDLLVLDEATSQLDPESERVIRTCLNNLPRNIAIVLVTHRTALLDCCDTIYRMEDGRLSPEGLPRRQWIDQPADHNP